MAELIAYLTFFHWNFDIIYLSPAIIFPVIYVVSKSNISLHCFSQKDVYFYLTWVLIVSSLYQLAIDEFVPKEFVTFLMQLTCYLVSWNIAYSAITKNKNNLKIFDQRLKLYLMLILMIIFISLISTVAQGYGYVHGQNLFGNVVLIAPEWPMFSASTMAAVIVFIEKRFLITILFVVILLAGQARATILMYGLYFIKNINPTLILFLIFFMSLLVVGTFDLSYLSGRFSEILIQLDVQDLPQYIALLSDNEIYNDRLYKEDNVDLIFPGCERLGDMGRVGNSVAALMYSSTRLIFGSGFTLSSTYLLCNDLGFYHPSGPAWNPIINSFIQGGLPGFIFLVRSIYKGYDHNLLRHKPYLLVILLLVALNIMKGLNSYQFWSLVAILNAYKFAYDKRVID